MTAVERSVKIVVRHVRLGAEEYRVISPAAPLDNGALYSGRGGFDMYVDRPDGHRIGVLWLLAARSRRSIVYLPMRGTPPAPSVDVDMSEPGWTLSGHRSFRPMDLVLVHHSAQFPPSGWPRLRHRLTEANARRELQTARIPASEIPTGEEADDPALGYRDNRDTLRPRVHAETLFLTGSAVAFRASAGAFFAVTRDGPPAAEGNSHYIAGSCNYHVCDGVGLLEDDARGNESHIHVEYSPSWTPRPQDAAPVNAPSPPFPG
jgi:hypothetical protein